MDFSPAASIYAGGERTGACRPGKFRTGLSFASGPGIPRRFHPRGHLAAVPVGLHGDPLDVDPRRRHVRVIQRLPRLLETPRLLLHDPRKRVPRLVQVHLPDPATKHKMLCPAYRYPFPYPPS